MKTPGYRSPLVRLGMGTASCLLLLVLAGGMAICVGGAEIPPGRVAQALWHAAAGGAPPDLPPEEWQKVRDIVLHLRLPRILLGTVVGFALASAGAALQGLLLNPLADPYIIGVSPGAGLGAALAILLGWDAAAGGLAVSGSAFGAALLALLAVFLLARRRGHVRPESFLIAGVAVGSFCWAGVTAVLTLAGQDMQKVVYWLMGSLSLREGYLTPLLAVVSLGWLGLALHAHRLNLLALGDETAHQLGVSVERTRAAVILAAALMTAAAVSVSGIIGFVGLMVPHMARRVMGPDQRVLLPVAALAGGAFLVLADTAARGLPLLVEMAAGRPVADLPVGVVTAIVGGPVMFALLRRGAR